MIDLATSIATLALRNPVTLASGTCGFGRELAPFLDFEQLGGIFTKAVTLEPRAGNAMPRLAETEHGLLNSIGLANPGLQGFVETRLPWLREQSCAVLVNVAGRCPDDYYAVLEALDGLPGIDGVELNLSCPNVREGGIAFGTDPEVFAPLVREARKRYRGLLVVKMTPQVSSVSRMAALAEDCGADALSLINTIPGMAIDIHSRRPRTITNTSGYSGAAIKPVAVAQVWQASRACGLPIVGIGGICCVEDVIEFLLAGASAVQIGTASFRDPGLAGRLIEELGAWCENEGVKEIAQLIGAVEPW